MTSAVRTAAAAAADGAGIPGRASPEVSITTRPSATRPTGPQTGEANAVTLAVCIFLT